MPVEASTVAMDVLLLLQLPTEALLLKVVLPPTQMPWVPLRAPALGGEVTFTDRVAVASAHPPVPATV